MSHIKSPSNKLLVAHSHLEAHFKLLRDNIISIDAGDEKCMGILKRMEIDISILKAQIEIKIKRAEQKYRNEHDLNNSARDIFFLMGRKD